MIQRIQTVFLLLAASCFGVLFGVPMAISDTATAYFLSDKVYAITDHPVLMTLTILGIAVSLITIFVFKNRKLQHKLVYIIITLAILLPLATFLLFTNESANIADSALVEDQIGMYIPIGAGLFGLLANHFIRKDDRLVKSMDRLR